MSKGSLVERLAVTTDWSSPRKVTRLLSACGIEVGQRLSEKRWKQLQNELRSAGIQLADCDHGALSGTSPGIHAKLRLRVRPRKTKQAAPPSARRKSVKGTALGKKLRAARTEAGLSQAGLAERLGVTQPAITGWESNGPPMARIPSLELVLGPLGGSAETGGGPGAVGSWLANARARSDLTVPELAAKADVSINQIYRIENGKTQNPQARTVRALETALGERLPGEVREVADEEATVGGIGKLVDFDPYDDGDRPRCGGIYVLYDISERPIYVGEGQHIHKRIRDHHEKFWFKRPIVETASYIRIEEAKLRVDIERVLIKFLKSNAVINKQNVERQS